MKTQQRDNDLLRTDLDKIQTLLFGDDDSWCVQLIEDMVRAFREKRTSSYRRHTAYEWILFWDRISESMRVVESYAFTYGKLLSGGFHLLDVLSNYHLVTLKENNLKTKALKDLPGNQDKAVAYLTRLLRAGYKELLLKLQESPDSLENQIPIGLESGERLSKYIETKAGFYTSKKMEDILGQDWHKRYKTEYKGELDPFFYKAMLRCYKEGIYPNFSWREVIVDQERFPVPDVNQEIATLVDKVIQHPECLEQTEILNPIFKLEQILSVVRFVIDENETTLTIRKELERLKTSLGRKGLDHNWFKLLVKAPYTIRTLGEVTEEPLYMGLVPTTDETLTTLLVNPIKTKVVFNPLLELGQSYDWVTDQRHDKSSKKEQIELLLQRFKHLELDPEVRPLIENLLSRGALIKDGFTEDWLRRSLLY